MLTFDECLEDFCTIVRDSEHRMSADPFTEKSTGTRVSSQYRPLEIVIPVTGEPVVSLRQGIIAVRG